jgi:ribosomal protein L22
MDFDEPTWILAQSASSPSSLRAARLRAAREDGAPGLLSRQLAVDHCGIVDGPYNVQKLWRARGRRALHSSPATRHLELDLEPKT